MSDLLEVGDTVIVENALVRRAYKDHKSYENPGFI